MVIAKRKGAVHEPLHLHFFPNDLPYRQPFALVDEVTPPELIGLQTRSLSYMIEVALQRKNGLRRAESAKGPVRRDVGGHRMTANPDIRTEIWTRGVNRATGEHYRREGHVRATVDDELDVHAQQLPVGIDPVAVAVR